MDSVENDMVLSLSDNLRSNWVYALVGAVVAWLGASIIYTQHNCGAKNALTASAITFYHVAHMKIAAVAIAGVVYTVADLLKIPLLMEDSMLRPDAITPCVASMMAMLVLALALITPLSEAVHDKDCKLLTNKQNNLSATILGGVFATIGGIVLALAIVHENIHDEVSKRVIRT